MASCCDDKACEIAALRASQSRVLWILLGINAAMFVVELAAGVRANSTSLLADSLDMLGDASVYALTLLAIGKSSRWQAGAALTKGVLMLAFAIGVIADGVAKLVAATPPHAETMGVVGTLALVANGVCFALLYRHRADNLNMSSTWLCSRNDLIANTGVIVAAVLTAAFAAPWPDLIIGAMIAVVFLKSAIHVLAASRAALRRPTHSSVSQDPSRPVPVDARTVPMHPAANASRRVSIPIRARGAGRT